MQLGEALFAFVALELGPIFKVVIEDSKRILVVLGQSDFLPKLLWQMGTFNGFHVEVAMSLVLEDSGVAGICQGAGMARAQAS